MSKNIFTLNCFVFSQMIMCLLICYMCNIDEVRVCCFLHNFVLKKWKENKVRHSSNTFKVSSRRNHVKDRCSTVQCRSEPIHPAGASRPANYPWTWQHGSEPSREDHTSSHLSAATVCACWRSSQKIIAVVQPRNDKGLDKMLCSMLNALSESAWSFWCCEVQTCKIEQSLQCGLWRSADHQRLHQDFWTWWGNCRRT